VELAKLAKNEGNKLFGEKKYAEAITCYTRAIDLSPDAIFYANRAACWANIVNIH
jgi:mitochondrial import receptor subunit TOM70